MSVEVDQRAILLGLGLLWSPGSMSSSSRIKASAGWATECIRRWPVVDERRVDTHTDRN